MQVYAWGLNTSGQLGLGDTVTRRSPAPVDALWAIPVVRLGAGSAHSAALASNGFLFTWGSNERGQLGIAAGPEASTSFQVGPQLRAALLGRGSCESQKIFPFLVVQLRGGLLRALHRPINPKPRNGNPMDAAFGIDDV
jgi:Regulator of chromosome condensation (RCC1) repeat